MVKKKLYKKSDPVHLDVTDDSGNKTSEIPSNNIFITGGAGFIGSNLVEFLIQKGYRKIKIYDNLSTGRIEYIEKILANFGSFKKLQVKNKIKYRLIFNTDAPDSGLSFNISELILHIVIADILDASALINDSKGYDAIVHLAAHTRVLESIENPEKNIQVNIIGTLNVMQAARINNVKIFIFASSNAAVGEQIPPINEKMLPMPISPYGVSKLGGEGLCSAYFNSYGLKTVSLRFANAYGPYSEHKESVVSKFIKNAIKGDPLELYGDGKQTRDFIHTADICQAIYLSLNPDPSNPEPWGEIFQITTGMETSIIGLASMISSISGQLWDHLIELKFKNARRGEIRNNYSDIRKAKKILGFRPVKKLNSGVRQLCEWYANNNICNK